jgi:hypothetical protein
MHRPVVGDSWLKVRARAFVSACEVWWVKNLIKPVFFLLPPMLLTAVATRQGLNEQVVQLFGNTIGDLLNGSALLILLGAYLYISAMKALYAGIEYYSKPARELGTTDLLAILKAINIVVGDKNKRFSTYLKKNLSSNSINPSVTFNEITRPDQQIALLIKSLHTVVEFMDDKNAFYRVGLMRVERGTPTEWAAFEPASHPPRTQPEQLAAPSSTISAAIKTKAIVIVEDIQEEMVRKVNKKERRFLRSNTQDGESGAQLCFPVIHGSTGCVEYVISIAGNKKACLVEEHAQLYSWIIEHFATRISLEHSLLVLKEKANVKEAA